MSEMQEMAGDLTKELILLLRSNPKVPTDKLSDIFVQKILNAVTGYIDRVTIAEVTSNPEVQDLDSKYASISADIGKLLCEKDKAYGRAWLRIAEFMKLLYPDGIKPENYVDALLIVRVFDKLSRIATDKDAFGESPWRDLAGYGILGAARRSK
jgi:hypothetical protein